MLRGSRVIAPTLLFTALLAGPALAEEPYPDLGTWQVPPGPGASRQVLAAGRCRWGPGRRRRCASNPMPAAIVFSALGGALTAGGIAGVYVASRDEARRTLFIPGVVGVAQGTALSAFASYMWAEYAEGMARKPPVEAAVSFSRASAWLGLRWSF